MPGQWDSSAHVIQTDVPPYNNCPCADFRTVLVAADGRRLLVIAQVKATRSDSMSQRSEVEPHLRAVRSALDR